MGSACWARRWGRSAALGPFRVPTQPKLGDARLAAPRGTKGYADRGAVKRGTLNVPPPPAGRGRRTLAPHGSPEFAARLGTLTNAQSAWRERWHEWALSAVLVHRCTRCDWQTGGPARANPSPVSRARGRVPRGAPQRFHHRGASSTHAERAPGYPPRPENRGAPGGIISRSPPIWHIRFGSTKPFPHEQEARKGAYGIRTRVTGVRGQRPRPLDECARRTRRVADGFRASGRQPVSAAMGRGPGAPPRWREARRGGKCYLRHPPRRRPRPNALAWLPAPLVRPARSRANVGELTTVCQRPGSAHCSEQRELHRDENSGDDEPHPPGHSRS